MIRLLLLTMCLVGCDIARRTDHTVMVCPVDDGTRAKFIVECAAAANPKSDEEGEDLVAECGKQAEKLFCTRERTFWDGSHHIPCSRAVDADERTACQ